MELYKMTNGFIRHLGKRRQFLSLLQLTGKLENYLVNEYVSYVFYETQGAAFGLTNLGITEQPKVDIVMLRTPTPEGDQEIYELIEAKYLPNRHRNWKDCNAFDEVLGSLKSLVKQLKYRPGETHGYYDVNLTNSRFPIGLIFSSYVDRKDDTKSDTVKNFHDKIIKRASRLGLHDIDSGKPTLTLAYEAVPVEFHGFSYTISLGLGVWIQ